MGWLQYQRWQAAAKRQHTTLVGPSCGAKWSVATYVTCIVDPFPVFTKLVRLLNRQLTILVLQVIPEDVGYGSPSILMRNRTDLLKSIDCRKLLHPRHSSKYLL